MAVRTMEEILESVRGRIGEDTSDEALAFIADITDTMTDLNERANPNGVNWQEKYEQNDAEWRRKYRDRFFSQNPAEPEPSPEPDTRKNYTFESLFKED